MPEPQVRLGKVLWRVTGVATGPAALTFRGENAVEVLGGDEPVDQSVRVVDAATGRVRWQQRVLTRLPGDDGHVLWDSSVAIGTQPSSPIVVSSHHYTCRFSRPDCAPFFDGVAALSPDGGRTRWTWSADPRTPDDRVDGRTFARPVAVQDGVVIVAVTDDGYRTVALDQDSGKQVWEQRGEYPQWVGEGLVLTSEDGPGAATTSHLRSLDDGAEPWSIPRGEEVSALVSGLIATTDADDVTDIYDLATGEVRASTSRYVVDGTAMGVGTMLAWTDDGVLNTLTAADDEPYTVSVGDDVGVGSTAGDLVVGKQQTLDRRGEPVRGFGKVRIVSYDEERVVAVAEQGPRRRSYTVYRNEG